jgi:hypothetical protein
MADGESVIPIAEGVLPHFDTEREMIDWFAVKLRGFAAEKGEPVAVAAVVFSRGTAAAYSWSPSDDGPSRGECCGFAAALLLKRAVG